MGVLNKFVFMPMRYLDCFQPGAEGLRGANCGGKTTKRSDPIR